MLEGLISLASLGFGGGRLGDVLASWEEMGVFDYLLPFLIIFALVFVILNSIRIFKENRNVNAVLALAVGLIALRFNFVPQFFSEVFPRLGVALSIILVILILVGLFIDPKKPGLMYTLLGVAAIITIAVFMNTADALNWSTASSWTDYLPEIITAIIFIAVIAVIVGVTNRTATDVKPLAFYSPN